jgi:hypothetical protein
MIGRSASYDKICGLVRLVNLIRDIEDLDNAQDYKFRDMRTLEMVLHAKSIGLAADIGVGAHSVGGDHEYWPVFSIILPTIVNSKNVADLSKVGVEKVELKWHIMPTRPLDREMIIDEDKSTKIENFTHYVLKEQTKLLRSCGCFANDDNEDENDTDDENEVR